MSFSSDLKKELSLVKDDKPCCALSELCGLYASTGSLSLLGRGKLNVQFISESIVVSKRTYTLLSQALRISPQIHYLTTARFGGTRKCVLTLGPVRTPELLSAFGMMERRPDGDVSLRSTSPRLAITRQCCARAYLRGVFLGGGTMSNPAQSYHLELSFRDPPSRETLAKCVQRAGLPIRESARGEKRFFYFKQCEQILTLLTAMGANASVMRIEDLRVQRQVLGAVNRAMNCDEANLQKQMEASRHQVEAIRRLRESDKFEGLSEALKEIAIARLSSPDATLSQLGAMLSPPIGKSGVNHRMRRLMALADEIENASAQATEIQEENHHVQMLD